MGCPGELGVVITFFPHSKVVMISSSFILGITYVFEDFGFWFVVVILFVCLVLI